MAVTEICLACDDLAQLRYNLIKVFQGGAERVELCDDMAAEGLTPGLAAIGLAREIYGERKGVIAMLRPRAGDFDYSPAEIAQMSADIADIAKAGADGVVFGVVSNGSFNHDAMTHLTTVAKAHGLSVACHRAFDAVTDKKAALAQLINLGFERVLTSGGQWLDGRSAADNGESLKHLLTEADNKIEIIIAGGVEPVSATKLFQALKGVPGKRSLHAFSGILNNTQVDQAKVEALVGIG